MSIHSIFDSKQLIQARSLARDIFDIQGAVDLPAFPPGPNHATDAQHPQMPRDPRLAHPQVHRQVVDALLAHRPRRCRMRSRVGLAKAKKWSGSSCRWLGINIKVPLFESNT